MEKGACLLSCIPIRAEASSRSEMVSQLIFGESYIVSGEKEGFLKIITEFDQYEGYISANQFSEYPKMLSGPIRTVKKKFRYIFFNGRSILVPAGSLIPIQSEENNTPKGKIKDSILIKAPEFLDVPYLWGGRTFMGMDCSGFIQILFKIYGMVFPRDSSAQEKEGIKIDFDNRLPGDLAFFQSNSGNITHVGLLTEKDTIIHASGKVRMDDFTLEGIKNPESGTLTHTLFSIKRVWI